MVAEAKLIQINKNYIKREIWNFSVLQIMLTKLEINWLKIWETKLQAMDKLIEWDFNLEQSYEQQN